MKYLQTIFNCIVNRKSSLERKKLFQKPQVFRLNVNNLINSHLGQNVRQLTTNWENKNQVWGTWNLKGNYTMVYIFFIQMAHHCNQNLSQLSHILNSYILNKFLYKSNSELADYYNILNNFRNLICKLFWKRSMKNLSKKFHTNGSSKKSSVH